MGVGGLDIFQGWLVESKDSSALQCYCVSMVWRGMVYHCQCGVSYQ